MSENNSPKSSTSIYSDIRMRLISAGFQPGQKMKPEDLRKAYGCAANTIREALFRLSCDGFLDFEEQKGFRMPNSSHAMLLELGRLRILLEQEGARLSIASGSLEWEANLLAAHHKLGHIEAKMRTDADISPHIPVWCESEWHFHKSLISACGSRLLRETHRNIYDRFRQHLVTERNQFGFRPDNVAEHQCIVDAALAGNAALCAANIQEHIQSSWTQGTIDWREIKEAQA